MSIACVNDSTLGGIVTKVGVFHSFGKPKTVIGIEVQDEGLNIAVRDAKTGKLSDAKILAFDSEGVSQVQQLSEWVEQKKLSKQCCNVVLPAKDYQLLMVEKPDVPAEELRQAVKWKLKDLVTSPLESLTVDVFEIPSTGVQQSKTMMYAVVTDLAKIKSVIDLVASAKLKLNAIDIDALALRNLILSQDMSRGIAILRMGPGSGELCVYRDGDLFLSRRFKLDYGGGLLDDLPADSLGLELQRSFDYLERQMRQVPPSVLYICGEGIGSEKIDDALRQAITIPVEFFELGNFVEFSGETIDEGISQVCAAAMGAAIREQGV